MHVGGCRLWLKPGHVLNRPLTFGGWQMRNARGLFGDLLPGSQRAFMELWFRATERIANTWTWPWFGGLRSCAVLECQR